MNLDLSALIDAIADGVVARLSEQMQTATSDGWVALGSTALPRRTLLRAAKAGQIKARRIGKEIFVDRASLTAWIDHQPSLATVAAPPVVDADPIGDALSQGRLRALRGGRR